MKKFFLCAVAVAATMSLTSCLSEEEVNLEKGNMGTISVNITADDQLATRADVTWTNPTTGWCAYVAQSGAAKFGASSTPRALSELAGFGFAAGTGYTINVYSHVSEDAAMPNGGLGAAYYTGTQKTVTVTEDVPSFADLASFSITAGQPTSVNVYCGKAQNARLAITNAEFAGTINSVTAVAKMTDGTTNRNVTFGTITNTENTTSQGYFHAGETVAVTINYTITIPSGTVTKDVTRDIHLAGAGTRNVLNIKSNSNGTITIANIYYDDDWIEGNVSEEITIDAATGNKLTE